jgi:hypothetical protein
MDVTRSSPKELLALHATVAEELRTLGITRSSNNPTGDLAEYLFCKAFSWAQAGNSNRNIDATAADGTRYQIKGHRMTRHSKSRQLSGIRDFQGRHFDFLAGVVFTETYEVLRAAIIPYGVPDDATAETKAEVKKLLTKHLIGALRACLKTIPPAATPSNRVPFTDLRAWAIAAGWNGDIHAATIGDNDWMSLCNASGRRRPTAQSHFSEGNTCTISEGRWTTNLLLRSRQRILANLALTSFNLR